jgi:outer membrane protein TolC
MLETTVIPGQPSEYAGDYADALENMMSCENLSWSAGLTLNVPLGNRAAKADLEKTLINYEKQVSDLHNQERQVFMGLLNLLYDLDASERNYVAAQEASRLQAQNLATEERKFSLGLNTNYEVLQAQDNWGQARSSEIGALVDYAKNRGRVERARQGYLSGGTGAMPSITLPPSLSGGGGRPSGLDASGLQDLMSKLPAGIDPNMLRQFMP